MEDESRDRRGLRLRAVAMDGLLRGNTGAGRHLMRAWRRRSWHRDGIIGLVCWCVVVTPMLANMNVARADDVVNEANKGQNTGANLLLNYNLPSISNAPPMDPLGPNEINIQELFPGYDPSDPSQITDLSDMAGNPEDLSTQGVAQQFSLGAGSDETAEAYQGIDAGAVNPHAAGTDLRTDGFLDRAREILAGNDPILDEILTA